MALIKRSLSVLNQTVPVYPRKGKGAFAPSCALLLKEGTVCMNPRKGEMEFTA